MYRLFYDYPVSGDVLYVVMEPESYPDEVVKKGNSAYLYKEKKLIGLNLFDISKIVKIHASGLLVTPDDKLIDIVNSILSQTGGPRLDYCRESGYRVLAVSSLEEHPLDEKKSLVKLKAGDSLIDTVTGYQNIKVGDLVVAVLDGTIKFDGTLFKASNVRNIPQEAEIMSEKDLHLGEDNSKAYLADPAVYSSGDDFFLGGH